MCIFLLVLLLILFVMLRGRVCSFLIFVVLWVVDLCDLVVCYVWCFLGSYRKREEGGLVGCKRKYGGLFNMVKGCWDVVVGFFL